MLKPRGYVNFIFTSSRINDLLYEMHGKLGNIIIYPLWSKNSGKSKLFIVQGRKGVKSPTKLSFGMVMHDKSGEKTKQLKDILENGQSLII